MTIQVHASTQPPKYRTDFEGIAADLRRTYGSEARDIAIQTTKSHLATMDLGNFAMWLQVVNRLNPPS